MCKKYIGKTYNAKFVAGDIRVTGPNELSQPESSLRTLLRKVSQKSQTISSDSAAFEIRDSSENRVAEGRFAGGRFVLTIGKHHTNGNGTMVYTGTCNTTHRFYGCVRSQLGFK